MGSEILMKKEILFTYKYFIHLIDDAGRNSDISICVSSSGSFLVYHLYQIEVQSCHFCCMNG